MTRFWMAASVAALMSGSATLAQTNGLDPANLPPAGFDGRDFVDSAGCAFLRSTFGGQVTWVPRFGPDRNPVCGLTPTVFASDATPAMDPPAEAAPETESRMADMAAESATSESAANSASPAPQGRIEIVGPVADSVRRAAPAFLGKEPMARAAASRPRTAKLRYPQADASGRHPSCPASAPFGQLVDTALGRKMVRCVTSPAQFLDTYVDSPVPQAVQAPRAAAVHGSRVQVGSFSIPGNAHRLVARLNASGLPAHIHRVRGLNVVTVGPFASGAEAHGALSQVRKMGFGDAFLRR